MELGGTGLRVSPIGFGCSLLGQLFDAVRRAIDLGVNVLLRHLPVPNTLASCRSYGHTLSESVLGDCLCRAAVPRDRVVVVVATKCGRYKEEEGFEFTAGRVNRGIDESPARMELDYVDILHCHDIESANVDQVRLHSYPTHHLFEELPWRQSTIVNETLPALRRIKETGKASGYPGCP
ncbi:hypothetical protein ACP70R_018316 [Stipagrostis hirtigluma subsp. patula]